MMASLVSWLPLLFLIFNLVSSKLVLEEGYTVTTVINGHKLNINPYSVSPRPGTSDLIVLDSVKSVFYTVSFPLSEETVVQRLSGDGNEGYVDGEPGSARFRRPKSFAVDMKGNIYVADKSNSVIRKLSNSGVSTIAGGSSRKVGHDDGPAQNASFSNDFELTFVPGICALLISDHGNQMVRQINLKAEDCARSSQSALGAVSISVLGLGLSCLLGMVIGIILRPYIMHHTGRLQPPPQQRDMEALPNQSGETSTDALLRHQKRSQISPKDVSLLDSNICSISKVEKSSRYSDQLKDLVSSNGNLDLLCEDISKQENDNIERTDVLADSHGKLEDMIEANIREFSEAKETTPQGGSLVRSSGLARRCK